MRTIPTPPWALLLAGGDGRRLRPLTRQIAGDPRPKQFCAILDGETLLDRTRRRAELLTRPDQHVVVEPYYTGLAMQLAPDRLVVQPRNAGTAPGILYPLLRIRQLAGDVPVAIFPSDHYVSDDGAFVTAVAHAVDVAGARPEFVVLLGVEATAPETEYGWIDPDPVPLPLPGEPAFPIRRFWEKPSLRLAERFFERGALWNSFVMVGRVETFLGLTRRVAPDLLAAFDPVRLAIGSPREAEAAERAYAALESSGFGLERLGPPAARDGHDATDRMAAGMAQPRGAGLGRLARPSGGMGPILVVEDDSDTRRALGELLTVLFPGSRVLMAESGEAALELIRRTRPRVVILDLHLGGIHGFDFAAHVMAMSTSRPPAIVALTGDASPDTVKRAEAAGFAAFLRKPADADTLETVLRPILEA